MTQLEIYKRALKALKSAKIASSLVMWEYDAGTSVLPETIRFEGLCHLISGIAFANNHIHYDRIVRDFISDSEKVLGKTLDDNSFWFTRISISEQKAREERTTHLKNLIKLYNNEQHI